MNADGLHTRKVHALFGVEVSGGAWWCAWACLAFCFLFAPSATKAR